MSDPTFDTDKHPKAPSTGRFVDRELTKPGITDLAPGPRVIARVQREILVGGDAIPVGEPFDIDVTEIIAEVPEDELLEIGDHFYDVTDGLYQDAVRRGLAPAHAGPISLTVEESLDDYRALTTIEKNTREFLLGSPEHLNVAQARALIALRSNQARTIIGCRDLLPDVAVHSEDQISLIYAPTDDFDGERTFRLDLDAEGKVSAAGAGEFWEDDDSENETLAELVEAGY